jgi:hypothetical protein
VGRRNEAIVRRQTPKRRYIEIWEARSRRRRARLKQALTRPVDALGALRKRNWLRRVQTALTTRKEWLQARLSHVNGLQEVVNAAIAQDTPKPTVPVPVKPAPVQPTQPITQPKSTFPVGTQPIKPERSPSSAGRTVGSKPKSATASKIAKGPRKP